MRRLGVRSRRGVTLAELILATGLAAIVMVSLVSVTDNAVRLWTRGEASRDAREVSSAVLGELNRDLRQLHPSSEGDLVIDWEPFDVERDGTNERLWPRLRFVRDASTAELASVQRRALAELAREARRHDHELGAFLHGQDTIHHFVHRLAMDRLSRIGVVRHSDAGEQESQVVVYLGHCSNGGAGVARTGLLVDRDGR